MDLCKLTVGFNTVTYSGLLLLHFLTLVAAMEREMIKKQTIAGLAAGRPKGGAGEGDKSAMTRSKVETARKLIAEAVNPSEWRSSAG